MRPKTIPTVTSIYIGFDDLAQSDDRTVIGTMQTLMRLSKKRLLPKSVRSDRCTVVRSANLITIHLYLGEDETGRFSFAPPPILSRPRGAR